jgi:glycosyltransferase involved in cell wall biosynthesis
LDWPVRHSALITTISEATKNEIVENTGCSPEKVIVIPDPMDKRFTYVPKKFNEEKPNILHVGTWPNKNLLRVIKALKGLKCHLFIVGKLSSEQESLLEACEIEFTCKYLLPQEELIECYRNADIVMFPTLFEGFGLPILEAQATGRPVITSNLSPMIEVAGREACLVDPFSESEIREAVIKITNDAAFREKLVIAGLQNIIQYSADIIAQKYFKVYQKVYKEVNSY